MLRARLVESMVQDEILFDGRICGLQKREIPRQKNWDNFFFGWTMMRESMRDFV